MVRPEQGSDYSRLFSSGYYAKSDEKEILAQRLTEYLKNETFDQALDVGPGDGRITRLIAERSKGLTAVEVEEDYRRSFRQNFPKAKLFETPIQQTNFPSQSFDLILASHVFYYLPITEWHSQLTRCYEWLRPEGRLICILNTPECEWWEFYRILSERLKVVPGFAYTDARAFFQATCGGVSECIEYDSKLVWQGDRNGLIEFLLAIFLALPLEMINEHNSRIVNDFIDEHTASDGSFSVGERAVIGIWKKAKK
ncbi:MAG: class I SAM-dependent methyltransferase [Deltaproteobacteria bacterium]|nr:class I SAM-dependent methyltransferase [Deltaproteobacteria bacterium]